MQLVVVFGPMSVGKMTVGQELEKISGFKLFHNHATIELVAQFFDTKSTSFRRLVDSFRIQMLKELTKSSNRGVIFTYVWWFDDKGDGDFMGKVAKLFDQVLYVELQSDVGCRLVRNRTENRLKHKPSKRNFEVSENDLIVSSRDHMESPINDMFLGENYLKIDNTHIDAKNAAIMIDNKFRLSGLP